MSQNAIIVNTPQTPNQSDAQDWASLFNAIIGDVSGVLTYGNELETQVVNNNKIRIKDGIYSMQGHIIRIPESKNVELKVNSGTLGVNRIDFLVVRYEKNINNQKDDTFVFEVIQGTPVPTNEGDPELPSIVQGNLLEGGASRTEVLYQINISETELSLVDRRSFSPSINKAMNEAVEKAPFSYDGAGYHNSVYRGKNLGTSVSSEQKARIRDGSFRDMFIGDYWVISGVTYRIAGFNYYKNTGSSAVTAPHVTLVPDTSLYTHRMNATDTTEGGYLGSDMYKTGLNAAKSTISSAFGDMILSHGQYFSNKVSNEAAHSWEQVQSTVDLMNEIMVYGSVAWGKSRFGGSGYNMGYGKTQLPLFRFRPDLIGIRTSYWLRDVSTAAYFSFVYSYGNAGNYNARHVIGVRPAFSIS